MVALFFIFFQAAQAQFCEQGLVSQYDKKLLSAYPKTPGLCSATCVGNLLTLIEDELASNKIANVLKVIELIKKSTKKIDPYDPNTDGVSFYQTIKTVSELAKRKNSKIKKIEAKSYSSPTPAEKKMIAEESRWVSFSNQKTTQADIKKSDRDWMILGLTGWLGRGHYSQYSHDVLARWDRDNNQVIIFDPAHPERPSSWEFIPGTHEYPARLRRVKGLFYHRLSVVGVEEWIKILTKN